MDVNLLQLGAGNGMGAAPSAGAAKAGTGPSAADLFRALVDVLAAGQSPAGDETESATDLQKGAPDSDASSNAPEGAGDPADVSAAWNSATTSVPSALVAGWAAVPPSDDEGDGSHRGSDGRSSNERRRSGDRDHQGHVIVPAWIAELPLPFAKPVDSQANADQGVGASGRHLIGDLTMQKPLAVLNVATAAAAYTVTAADAADRVSLTSADGSAFGDDVAAIASAIEKAQAVSAADLIKAAAQAVTQAAAQTSGVKDTVEVTPGNGVVSAFFKTPASVTRAEIAANASVAPAIAMPHLITYTASTFSTLLSSSESTTAARASALPDTTAAQIIQAIRLQAMGDGGEAHIRLEPSHFGELSVSIKVEQGQVVARLEAASPAVREWLQSNQGLLRGALADQQLTLSRLEIAEPQESNGSSNRRGNRDEPPAEERRAPRRPREADSDEPFEVVA